MYDKRHEEIENDYFTFLIGIIGGEKEHRKLLLKLFHKEFYDIIGNDQNRIVYGKMLRNRYLIEHNLEDHDLEFLGVCTVLEMMIALAESIDFEIMWDGTKRQDIWFWEMIENLELYKYDDSHYRYSDEKNVDYIIDRLLDRTYDADGYGGLFPIDSPHFDQRYLEIWYQAQTYFHQKLLFE